MTLNDDPPVSGSSLGDFTALQADGPLIVGGRNGGEGEGGNGNRDGNDDKDYGFYGCVKSLSFNGADFDFRLAPKGDAIGGRGVKDNCRYAGKCRKQNGAEKCANGGTCVEEFEEEEVGVKVREEENSEGVEKDEEEEHWGTGRRLKLRSSCICPLGFQGKDCRKKADLSVPSFDGRRSYVKLQGMALRLNLKKKKFLFRDKVLYNADFIIG